MKQLLYGSLVIMIFVSLSGCRKHDYREITIHVPAMQREACAQRVRQALAPLPGLKADSISFDLASRSVTLTYDSLLAANKNAEYLISEAGFEVVSTSRGSTFTIPANAEAAATLPPDCRP